MRVLRWTVLLVIAGGFFALALSNEAYDLTSPPALSYHVLLRKAYSIAAFTIVGAALRWAWRAPAGRSLATATVAVAAYSALIEVGQKLTDGQEPLVWNLIDVACGAAGGALAAFYPRGSRAMSRR